MNKALISLLESYNTELFKMGVHPKQCEDYCGQIGCKGLEDEKIQLEHISWMVRQLLDNSSAWPAVKINRWLGFVQGILWGVKFRGILELRTESMNI